MLKYVAEYKTMKMEQMVHSQQNNIQYILVSSIYLLLWLSAVHKYIAPCLSSASNIWQAINLSADC